MTESSSNSNKRIARNTFLLYIRMFVTIVVSLYTSRIILSTLGVEDFGIYNIVGSIIVLFSFINGALVTSTQRFINFEIGRKDIIAQREVFSASLIIYILFCILIVVAAETVGISFLSRNLKIPEARLSAVKIVYQYSLFTFCINIIRVPYNALVIAHEKMSFYAYLSILEVILKLGVVYLLFLIEGDKLIIYSILTLAVSGIILFSYWFYCRRSFPLYTFFIFFKKNTYVRLLSFSGWSLFGSTANLMVIQGINLIFNVFHGVVINASLGITNQVKNAVNSFLSSFQVAFSPQMIKSYAAGEKDRFYSLLTNSSRYSYYLMYIIVVPFIINAEFIIHKWLDSIPIYVVQFCQLSLVTLLIDSLSAPLGIAIQAFGSIKKYQIYYGILSISVLPVIYILTRSGKSPEFVYLSWTVVNFILYLWKVNFVTGLINLKQSLYLRDVVVPVLIVTLISLPIILTVDHYLNISGWLGFLLSVMFSLLASIVIIFTVGMESYEKSLLIDFFKNRVLVLIKK